MTFRQRCPNCLKTRSGNICAVYNLVQKLLHFVSSRGLLQFLSLFVLPSHSLNLLSSSAWVWCALPSFAWLAGAMEHDVGNASDEIPSASSS